jgi:phosphoribosylformylglycinamidine cyclo-ligase
MYLHKGSKTNKLPAYPKYFRIIPIPAPLKTGVYPIADANIELCKSGYLCRVNPNLSLYEKRGVSANKEDVHAAIKNLSRGLYSDTFCKILPDLNGDDDNYCTIMHADTAGTKSVIAYLYWKETGDLGVWKGIVQDAIVMNLDDMICSGANGNIILSSTISRNKHLVPGEVLTALIEGCRELLEEWKAFGVHLHLAGGETADVGDLVRTVDVGYTAYSRFPKKNVIHVRPQPGDVIIGFSSSGQAHYESEYNSGIGCNGLTSARHDMLEKGYANRFPESFDPFTDPTVCYNGKFRLTDSAYNNINAGKLLLSPTRTYAPVLNNILKGGMQQIHGIIHNTGGGQTKCLKYIGDNLRLVKDNLFEPPPIFDLIQQQSGAGWREMYQVFNMGHRLEIYTSAERADEMIAAAAALGVEAKQIGRVEVAPSKQLLLTGKFGSIEYQHA